MKVKYLFELNKDKVNVSKYKDIPKRKNNVLKVHEIKIMDFLHNTVNTMLEADKHLIKDFDIDKASDTLNKNGIIQGFGVDVINFLKEVTYTLLEVDDSIIDTGDIKKSFRILRDNSIAIKIDERIVY